MTGRLLDGRFEALGCEEVLGVRGCGRRVGVRTLDGEPPARLVRIDDPEPAEITVAELDDVAEREAGR